MKGFATLDAGLITRRRAVAEAVEPPTRDLLDALEDRGPHEEAPHQLDAAGHQMSPSRSLTANLISAGRAAYRAERQRQAEKTEGLSSRGEMLGVLPFGPAAAPHRHGGPTLRDIASLTLRDVATSVLPRPLRSQPAEPPTAARLRSVVPSRPEPVRLSAPAVEAPGRRRAVTLRLRPEQHARLLLVRRQLGCSFQALVVRALSDHLDAVARDPAKVLPARDQRGSDQAITSVDLGAALAADPARQGHKVPDVHYFALPNGWGVAAWRQRRGAEAATPSEVLGQVLKDQGVAELLQASAGKAAPSVLESVSLGDGGHRLALTIRLDRDMHNRLQAARDRLGRTGQDILMDSIKAYLDA
jgi:hypothetical protein